MNEQELEKIIDEHIDSVPSAIKEYLASDSFPQVFRDIIANQHLHIDTAYEVEVQTILLLLGLKNPQDYVTGLQEAGLSKEQALAVTKEINEKVMTPIFESYKEPKKETVSVNPFAHEIASETPEIVPPEPEEEVVPTPPEQPPIPTTPPAEEKKIEKKYAIDPYREPIE